MPVWKGEIPGVFESFGDTIGEASGRRSVKFVLLLVGLVGLFLLFSWKGGKNPASEQVNNVEGVQDKVVAMPGDIAEVEIDRVAKEKVGNYPADEQVDNDGIVQDKVVTMPGDIAEVELDRVAKEKVGNYPADEQVDNDGIVQDKVVAMPGDIAKVAPDRVAKDKTEAKDELIDSFRIERSMVTDNLNVKIRKGISMSYAPKGATLYYIGNYHGYLEKEQVFFDVWRSETPISRKSFTLSHDKGGLAIKLGASFIPGQYKIIVRDRFGVRDVCSFKVQAPGRKVKRRERRPEPAKANGMESWFEEAMAMADQELRTTVKKNTVDLTP